MKNGNGDKPIRYKAPAVHRAFQLLRAVAEFPNQLNLTALSNRLGYSKSTTHGLVHALLREDALTMVSQGNKFSIGQEITDLAFSTWNYPKITQRTQPVIDAIRDRIHETVFLGVMIRKRVLIVNTAESSVPLKISATPGTTIPLLAGAVGKVILAGKRDDEVISLIREKGLPAYSPRSIVDEDEYLTVLTQVRDQGFAIDDEEYLTGIRAVAVAVANPEGPPMAVWVVGLSSTMSMQKMQAAVAVIQASVADIQDALTEVH
jgi:DNA-binding IclR family transcriptional regulator